MMRKLNLIIEYLFELGPAAFADYSWQRFIKRKKVLALKAPGLDHKIYIRTTPCDLQVFTQIFILKEYATGAEKEINTIIDCGANIGLASLFFISKFPKVRIVAIEPEENNFKMLERNLAHYKNVTCIKKAIWDKPASLQIINHTRGDAGFIIKESPALLTGNIEAISINEIINEFHLDNIDILKIDIEGSEEQVFLNCDDWLPKVSTIFCEIHENLKPGLTKKIKSILSPYFECRIHGEYHVFEKSNSIEKRI